MATTYHVATDGSGDFTTIAQVIAANFSAGDEVLFRRGDTWREVLSLDSGSSFGYITYGAYGTGSKPKLLGSVTANSGWTDLGSNIWSNNNAAFTVDVGNLIFNNEESTGVKKKTVGELTTQGDFWYDFTNDLIKMYSVGNPSSVYLYIECALRQNVGIISIASKQYVILENLDLRYGGRHGIAGWSASNIIIRDCDISYIGGADQYGDYTVRLGNAIEFFDNASDCLVERCLISQSYDAALTNQGSTAGSIQNNIIYRNNILVNNEYGFEIWLRDSTSVMSNIHFINNTVVNSGSWSHNQRWDNPRAVDVQVYTNTAQSSNINIKNNIFYGSLQYAVRFELSADWSEFDFDYNLYFGETSGVAGLGYQGALGLPVTEYITLADWQTASNQDLHSLTQDPLLRSDYGLTTGSPAINAGVSLPEVTDDYLGVRRGASPDIGAYEWMQGLNFNGVTLDGVVVS